MKLWAILRDDHKILNYSLSDNESDAWENFYCWDGHPSRKYWQDVGYRAVQVHVFTDEEFSATQAELADLRERHDALRKHAARIDGMVEKVKALEWWTHMHKNMVDRTAVLDILEGRV